MTHIEKQEEPVKIEYSLIKEINKFPELVEIGKLLHTKVPKSDYFSYWIETKYITPNPLQTRRFFPKDGKIFIQLSPVLTKIIKELKVEDGKQINVRGPSGIGKSVALLHWVVCVRGHPFIRVFYINNPENLTNFWHLTIIKELIYTMARDIDTWEETNDESVVKRVNGKTMGESFVLYCQSLESEGNTAGIIQLLTNYRVYCASKRIILVCVFDQKKHFERNHNQNVFFKDTMIILSRFHMTINGISDVSNQAMSDEALEIFLTEKFTIKQAINYLSEKMPEFLLLPEEEPKTPEEWKKFPEFKKIYDTTDFHPYEMEKFVQEAIQNPNLPFERIFENFYKKRYIEIAQTHDNWIKSYTFIPDSKLRYKFMYKMSLGLRETESLLDFLVSPDPNLFYSDYTVKPSCVRFASRIVENALYRLYTQDDDFWEAINSDLYEKYNAPKIIINDFTQQSGFKGSLFEKYFECTMRVASLRHSLLTDIPDKDTTYNLWFEDREGKKGVIDLKTIKRFVHFNDSQLLTLLRESLDRSGVEVLVPNSPSFEYVDFILVDTTADPIILYLIQATINIYDHEKVDIILKSEYGALLNENKEGKSKEVSFKSAKPISQVS